MRTLRDFHPLEATTMTRISHARAFARYGTGVLGLVAAFSIQACNRDQLLEVQTPDQITTTSTASASGAQAQRVAAIGLFARFFGGDIGGGGISLNLTTAILADEAYTARSGTEHLDSRTQNPNSFPANAPWSPYGNAYNGIVRAIRALNAYPPAAAAKATQIGQLYMLDGFTFTLMAESYCNGIPVSKVTDDAPGTVTMSTTDLYNRALIVFDSALTTLSTSTTDQPYRLAARVGKARTYVNLNQYDKAVAVLAAGGDGAGSTAVPTTFSYNVEFSNSTALSVNSVYDWMLATKNFGASDKEGTTGLDYVSSKDPRILVDGTKVGPGQDGTPTPLMNQFTTTNAPVTLASGIEARLIEAENYLKTGDNANYLASLNAARATKTALAPLTDPGTATSRVDMLFRERAFWMYFTSHRLGDMRRLIRQYGRGSETVFPTGPYLHGGVYGTEVVLVPAQTELNNPDWGGPGSTDPKKVCTDMKA
jgi:hypothetical protein